MRIAVFGSGGVGGYFGGRLATAGEDVVFSARGAHLQAIKESGLRVDSLNGDFVVYPAHATSDPQQVGEVEVILVGVKAWQVLEVAHAMLPLIGESTFVVPLQNGIDAPFQLAEVLGAEHVLGGMCQIVAFISEPGHIRHVGLEPYIAFGELDNHQSERTGRLLQAFKHCEVKAEVPTDIHLVMWDKYLFITALSGVGAATRAPAGILRSLPETRLLLEQLMREVVVVAQARRVSMGEETIKRRMAFIDGLAPGSMTSMQRDLLGGRPSELEAILGSLVRMGQQAGVPTPICEVLYHSLLPQEQRARKSIDF
jgi:2-dehydropantoate 2-reductase